MLESNIRQRLLVLRGTLRRAMALHGAGLLIAALVGSFFISMLLDYFVFRLERPINTGFRTALFLGFIGTAAYIIWFKLVAPLSVPLEVDDMALAVEKEFPNLNDSLISAVQLTRMMSDDGSVSTPMVEEIARQAYQSSAALDFKSVVKFDRIKPMLIAGAGALVLFLGLLAFPPTGTYLRTGMLRLLNPLSNISYPVRTYITIKGEQHELIAPRNEALHIIAEVSGSDQNRAFIQFDYGSGYGPQEPITNSRSSYDDVVQKKSTEYDFEYNPILSNFSYVIHAGDNETAPHFVRAVDRPRMDNLDVIYTRPSYISDAPTPPSRDTTIRNVIGSKAALTGEANKPLRSAKIKLGDAAPHEMSLSTDRKLFSTQFDLDSSKDYEIFLTDDDGLDNHTAKIRHRILVQPDNVPKVSWKKPAADLEVTPVALVTLLLSAEDDFGLQKALVKFKRYHTIVPPAPAGGQNAPAPVIDTSTPAVEGTFDLTGAFGRDVRNLDFSHEWNLTEMNLVPGEVIEYWAEAYDWCPTRRKPNDPQIFKLKILSVEELHRRLDIERLRLVEELIAIIRMEESDKRQVTAVADHLGFGNTFDNSQRTRVSEAASLQEEARRKTQSLQHSFENLIGRYKDNGLDTPDETDRLRTVAGKLTEEHSLKMPDASKQISSSAMLKEDPARIASLKQAIVKQTEILSDLNELLALMQKWAETEELLRMTRELLEKQRAVTKATVEYKDKLGSKLPSEASKEQLNDVKGLEHRERDCASDMKQLFTRMTQALAKMIDLDKFVAKNIDDAIKIAQNTDASPDNPDLAKSGDAAPGIEEKMNSAQTEITKFNFGVAGGKQRASETALQRIITVLSRRRAIDQKLLNDIAAAQREARKNLEDQRELSKRTKAIEDKEKVQKEIAAAKQKLSEIQQRERALQTQTNASNGASNPEAAGLDAALDAARKDLDSLIGEQTEILGETMSGMTPGEKDLSQSLATLEELEAAERKLAERSDVVAKLTAPKANSPEAKKTEHDMIVNADEQADLRTALDNIIARLAGVAAVAKNGASPDPKVTLAGTAADTALKTLDTAGKEMSEASDILRKGSAVADTTAAGAGAMHQKSAADLIAKTRQALNAAASEVAKDRAPELQTTAGKQQGAQGKADALKTRLGKLSDDIKKAHDDASGPLKGKPEASPSSASAKIGEASTSMNQAAGELKKTSPAGAAKDQSQALSALGEARKLLGDLKKAVEELKDPARRLERAQGDLKEQARQIAEDIKNIEGQLSETPLEPKASEHVEKAAAAMQNAQNSLGKSSSSKSGASGAPGDSKSGQGSPDDKPKEGAPKEGSPANSGKSGENTPPTPPNPIDKADAQKHEAQALSELDKALNQLDALSGKNAKEGDDHPAAALKRQQEKQLALRENVQKLQSKLKEMEDKTGNEKSKKASKANESAANKQSQASGQMSKGDKSGSQSSQEEAEQDLQEVLDNLDQFKEQMQDQTRKEKLFQIEEALKKMLDTQKNLLERTVEVDKVTVARAKKGMTQQIFKEQLDLSDASRVIVKQLEEAPVFQWVLQTAVDDMAEAAARLDKEKTGASTQEIQDDAAKKLADLIEALRKERTKPNPGGGGGGGGGGKQPLVPPVAQLKMLRIMQKDVNTRVKRIDDEIKKAPAAEAEKDLKDRQRRAAAKEGDIARITDKIAREFEGPPQAAPGDPKGDDEKDK